MIARIGVGVVALAVIVSFAWLERDARLLNAGVAAAKRHDLATALRDLTAAGKRNPDPTPELTRAALLLSKFRRAEAEKLADAVIRREPDNLDAWVAKFRATVARSPVGERQAIREQARLDPLTVPKAGGGAGSR